MENEQLTIQGRRFEYRSPEARSSLRAWLAVIDAVLRAVEETVWRLRRQTAEACRASRAEWTDWVDQLRDAKSATESWQQQTARLVSIGWTLTKIATGYRLHLTQAAFVTRSRAGRMLERLHAKNAQRFTDLCVSHGGGFLKVGQLLSSRPDLLPQAWIEALSILQDEVPAEDEDRIAALVEDEIGVPLEQAFREFERTPMAAASIGQVHRAVLNDETLVAVKVQRPSIESVIELDMKILVSFLDAMKTSLPPADYDTIVKEVRETIREELDYRAEHTHTSTVGDYLGTLEGVRAPKTLGSHRSKRVLVTELISGEKITSVLDRLAEARERGDQNAHVELSRLLNKLVEAYARQMLELGRFQADPHPGNLWIEPDHTLVILDFGCTKIIEPGARRAYAQLLQAFFVQDTNRMSQLLQELGFRTRSGRPDTLLWFAELMLDKLRSGVSTSTRTVPNADVIDEWIGLLKAAEEDPVMHIPDHFVMIGRVFAGIGGLIMHYRPTMDLQRILLPALLAASSST